MNLGFRIRSLRKRRGLTLKEIAKKTGYTESFISQVERGLTSPSIASLKKISAALGIALTHFFDSKIESKNVFFLKKGQGKKLNNLTSRAVIRLLAPNISEQRMEPFLNTMEPGSTHGKECYAHQGEEFAFVVKGKMEVLVGNKSYMMEEGDSIYFDSSLPHGWKNVGNSKAEIIWVVSPPTF